MSTKFKKGDLVELLDGNHDKEHHSGMVGTIIKYLGDTQCIEGLIIRAWEVQFPTKNELSLAEETVLRLIPGGDEYKEVGSWDEIPFVGKLFEKSKEKKRVLIDLTNPF